MPSMYKTLIHHQVANLTVDTVAVGAEADKELELLAVHTGGDSFSHTDGSSEIYLSFFKAAAAQMSMFVYPSFSCKYILKLGRVMLLSVTIIITKR